MPRLPHDRLVELLKLYDDYRKSPIDEVGKRLEIFKAACIKAADDYDGGAISGEELSDVVSHRWHAENRVKPSDVKK